MLNRMTYAALLLLCATACSTARVSKGAESSFAPGSHSGSRVTPVASASATTTSVPAEPESSGVRTVVFGHSVHGVPLTEYARGPVDAGRRILVVGCIHGNECAGVPIALDALKFEPPAGTEVVVVPQLNPDGYAANTRQNAHGVDLNRNFPLLWKRLGHRGDQQFSGTGPLSEPESAAMADLIRQLKPSLTIWFHQPVGVVDLSGGSQSVERRFAQVAGMQVMQLQRYPGSASGWQNSLWPGQTTAFVVELGRPATSSQKSGCLRGILSLERGTPP